MQVMCILTHIHEHYFSFACIYKTTIKRFRLLVVRHFIFPIGDRILKFRRGHPNSGKICDFQLIGYLIVYHK